MLRFMLQSFGDFTQAQMLFFSIITLTLVYASISLRSVVSMVTTTLTIVVLVGVMQFDLALEYFWYMLIINFVALSVSVIVSVQYRN